jgi:hypothetical protein
MHSTEHHRKLNSPQAAEYLGISASRLSNRRVDREKPLDTARKGRAQDQILAELRERNRRQARQQYLSRRLCRLGVRAVFQCLLSGAAPREWYDKLTEPQRPYCGRSSPICDPPPMPPMKSPSSSAKPRRNWKTAPPRNSCCETPSAARAALPRKTSSKTPLAHSDLRSLAVKIRRLPDGAPDWKEVTADMLCVIADLNDPDDTAINGRFESGNREVLEQMRQAERDAWSTIEHRLGDRDRELREQRQ